MEYPPKENEFDGVIRSFVGIGKPQLELSVHGIESERDVKENIFNFETKNEEDSPHLFINGSSTDFPALFFTFPNEKLFITQYTIRSHVSTKHFLKSWSFSGSNDGLKWTPIHGQKDSNDLNNGNITTYQINNPKNKFFSKYKLESNGTTNNGEYAIRILNIDFYGIVTTYLLFKSHSHTNFIPVIRAFLFSFLNNS